MPIELARQLTVAVTNGVDRKAGRRVMMSLMSLLDFLPASVHRLALRVGHRLRVSWQQLGARPGPGCALIVQNELGHVLLVRHTYVDRDLWRLPGGGVARGEAPLAAAGRELREEVECVLHDARLIEFEDVDYWGTRQDTFVVSGFADLLPRADLREIREAAFFPISDLPPMLSEQTMERLARWRLRNALPVDAPAFIRLEYLTRRHRYRRVKELPRRN